MNVSIWSASQPCGLPLVTTINSSKSYQTERDARMRESSPNEESLLVLRVWGRRRLTDSWCLHHLKLVTELRAPPRLWMSDRTSGMKPQDCDPSSRSVSSHPSPSPSLPRSLLLLFTSSHPLLLHFLSLSLSVWFCEKAGPNLRFSTSVSSTESVYPCAIFYVHSNENFKS